MEQKNKFVTVVTDERGQYSLHTSFKSACQAYGWKYKKTVPQQYNGYKIMRVPFNVTINCLELLEFIYRKDVVITFKKGTHAWYINIHGYMRGYDIYADYKDDEYTLTKIREVNNLGYRFSTIDIDPYTAGKLLELLNQNIIK
jgi:hypothetical protein